MLGKSMIASERLCQLWTSIKREREIIKAKEDHVKAMCDEVKSIMGDCTEVFITDGLGIRSQLFTYFEQPGYYRLDEKSLKEASPLIWENHRKFIEGGRRFRVI
ncbi:MAG: hypothetical protein UD961_04960 [Bacteroidales bacterium]|nr:hypothetical protein [Bacteroidales bacterium]